MLLQLAIIFYYINLTNSLRVCTIHRHEPKFQLGDLKSKSSAEHLDINHLFEADDGDGGAADHQKHADHEEEVKKLILKWTLWKPPVRNLQKELFSFFVAQARFFLKKNDT